MILNFSGKAKSSKQDLDAQEVAGMTQAQMIAILILILKKPIMESTKVKVTMVAEKESP